MGHSGTTVEFEERQQARHWRHQPRCLSIDETPCTATAPGPASVAKKHQTWFRWRSKLYPTSSKPHWQHNKLSEPCTITTRKCPRYLHSPPGLRNKISRSTVDILLAGATTNSRDTIDRRRSFGSRGKSTPTFPQARCWRAL